MDIGYRVYQWLQADRMTGMTEAIVFTDSYKHMECLGGMRLQRFQTNGYFPSKHASIVTVPASSGFVPYIPYTVCPYRPCTVPVPSY